QLAVGYRDAGNDLTHGLLQKKKGLRRMGLRRRRHGRKCPPRRPVPATPARHRNMPTIPQSLPSPASRPAPRHIALAVFPAVQALDVAGPLDVFSEANGYLPEGAGYTLTVLSADGEPVRASNGLRIGADASFEAGQGPYDLALVAGG